MRRVLCGAELLAYRVKRGGIVVVAVNVAKQRAQLVEGGTVQAAVLLDARPRPRAQLFEGPARLGDPDDRHVEVAALGHGLQ